MKRLILFFSLIFFVYFSYSQNLTELGLSNYEKYNLKLSNEDSTTLKVIFPVPVTSFYPNNVKINIGEVATLKSFSQETYKIEDFNDSIPYLKILLNGEEIWIKGSDAFIFNKDIPDTSFKLNNVEYLVFLSGNIKYSVYSDEDYFSYVGCRLIVIYNTLSHQYFLLKSNEFPQKLEGHSYKSNFTYLQDDLGVNEYISKINTEKNFVEFIIFANYQEGNAQYSIIFFPYNSNIPVKYTSIKIE